MKVEERLFSVEDTAERLGMSKWTITDWIKAGRLKGTKIGKFWRVRESDLEAFITNPPPLKRITLATPQPPTPPTNGTATPPETPADTPQARKAALLARIRALHQERLSAQAIATRLNQEGVPTISGRGQWQRGTVANLLAQAEGSADA
ncbi:MAG: helix-turn-helix domain-containing protein [Candidatus Entotheonellia bacterium]